MAGKNQTQVMTPPKTGPLRRIVRIHQWATGHPILYYLLPLAIWAALLIYGSLASSSHLPKTDISDKVQHGIGYGILGWLMLRALVRTARPRVLVVLATLAVASALGLLVEFMQYLLPHRSFDLLDARANAIGAFIGMMLWIAWGILMARAGQLLQLLTPEVEQ